MGHLRVNLPFLHLETHVPEWLGIIVLFLGLFTASYLLYRTTRLLYLHYLHRSSLARYQHPKDSKRAWALVTGASDGIGKGFAQELCQRGFNVVIHGRNENKLQGVADELRKQWPDASISIAVLDAYPITEKALDEMVASLSELPITVLVNNVGGSGPIAPIFRQLHALSYNDISTLIGINLDFPVTLTAKLLPALRAREPAVIINVGSFTGGLQSPYLSVYAGTKAFVESWSRSMSAEMKADGDDVEVLGLIVGEVQASWNRSPTSFMRPSSRRLAKDALDKVGCGRRIVTPYIGHELAGLAVGMMPEWLSDMVLIGVAKTMKEKDEEKAQKTA